MKIVTDRLNPQALVLEKAQDDIRQAVKDATLRRLPKATVDKTVLAIISRALARVSIPDLKQAAYRSLVQFYQNQRRLAAQIPQRSLFLFLALTFLTADTNSRPSFVKDLTKGKALQIIREQLPGGDVDRVSEYGLPLQKYHRDYAREVYKAFKRMADDEALDPDSDEYWGKRSSLRNRAEREVRFNGTLDDLNALKGRGVRLVIVSSHADCSERCRPWQGGVYSLDGTSGVTNDGRKYIPLEVATDIYTKNGKWKKGLFGFNCRHFAIAYRDGYEFPKTSATVEAKEYAITVRQRYMERQVRFWRKRAEMACGVDHQEYLKAKGKAQAWARSYERYSHSNNRAYYSSRIQI